MVSDGVGEALTVLLALAVVLGVLERVSLEEGVAELEAVGEGVLLMEMLPVRDAVTPRDCEVVGDTLTVELVLRVLLDDMEMLGVGDEVPVVEGVPVLEAVPEAVPLGVPLLLKEALPVLEGEAPSETGGVGDTLTVELVDREGLGVAAGVPVPEGVSVPDGVAEGVVESEPLLLCEMEPVLEALAPLVRDGVAEMLTVVLADTVELGVMDGVGVAEGVGVPDVVDVGVGAGVELPLKELLLELEGWAPSVSEAVGDTLTVVLPLCVVLGVPLGVTALVGVPEPVGVPEGVEAAEGVVDSVAVVEGVPL